MTGMDGMATTDVYYSVMAKPNCALTPRGMLVAFTAVASFSLVVAIGFCLAGAWLVFPFAGLELLVLAAAFYAMHCHSQDYESITITGDDLAIERRNYKNISRVVFHRYWASVQLRNAPYGEQRLWLRSHGKEVEIGRYMDNDARLQLASQLRQRVGAVY